MTTLERVLLKEIFYILTESVLIISNTKEVWGKGLILSFNYR